MSVYTEDWVSKYSGTEGTTELHQRPLHHDDQGDDLSYSSGGEDRSDSDYGADKEDNSDIEISDVKEDPGPFRYNRKMMAASLPCAVLLSMFVGEVLLITVSFGAALIIMTDPKGEKKRCVILFTCLFVPCHMFTLYSVFPLIWLSVFNILLIGVINIYVILTAGLMIIQLSHFRKYEIQLTLFVEQMLFSVYPGACIVMLTWATGTVIRWDVIPFVCMAYGFIYLQLFLYPHSSSFRYAKTGEEEDLSVLPQGSLVAMAILYCAAPSLLYVFLILYFDSVATLATLSFLIHSLFILALSVFLTTLMSLRLMSEFTGVSHQWVVTARWVSGALSTILCYPVLVDHGLTSQFLPWLPAAIAGYSVYGVLLSDKKFKVVSMVCLPVLCVLFAYWLFMLPWKLVYDMMFGIHLTNLYILLLINCTLCFLSVYMASYGSQHMLELVLLLQSLVMTLCEVLLYNVNLYPKMLLLLTASLIIYALHRLYTSSKLSLMSTSIISAIHLTKALVVAIYILSGSSQEPSLFKCISLYFLSFVFIKVMSLDTRLEIPVPEVVQNIVAVNFAIIVNTNPVIHMVCLYVLWEQPTPADLVGLCLSACGISSLVIGLLQLQEAALTLVRQLSISAISVGIIVIILQPQLTLTWSSFLQWGDVGAVVLAVFVLLTDRFTSLRELFICAVIVGINPGLRAATWLYEEDAENVLIMCRIAMYIPACIGLSALLFLFAKFELVGRNLEKCVLYLCAMLVALSMFLLTLDLIKKDRTIRVMSLPAWKLLLATSAIISIALKIISTQKDLMIPLSMLEDKKEKELPRLPFMGNITTILAFILSCLLCPFRGYVKDIWCCASSLILICLQKDMRIFSNLKQQNQVVPTMMTSVTLLFISTLIHTDLWHSSGLMFFRSLLEVISLLLTVPIFYVLWGILWKTELVLSDKWVVFLLPMNFVYILYGSSYTSQTLGAIGLFASIWMMATKLPLRPYEKIDR